MAGIALDTNVLVYAEGLQRSADDAAKVRHSRELTQRLLAARIKPVVPLQVLAELHRVLVSRGERTAANASLIVAQWAGRAATVSTDDATFASALSLAAEHHLQVFDAIILAGAASAGCDGLLSEDLHDGFAWRGVTILNPFRPDNDGKLRQWLGEPARRG